MGGFVSHGGTTIAGCFYWFISWKTRRYNSWMIFWDPYFRKPEKLEVVARPTAITVTTSSGPRRIVLRLSGMTESRLSTWQMGQTCWTLEKRFKHIHYGPVLNRYRYRVNHL